MLTRGLTGTALGLPLNRGKHLGRGQRKGGSAPEAWGHSVPSQLHNAWVTSSRKRVRLALPAAPVLCGEPGLVQEPALCRWEKATLESEGHGSLLFFI